MLFLSKILKNNFPNFSELLLKAFNENNITIEWIKNTKDIWLRDFMPIQVDKNTFIQFNYDPDYLKPKKYAHLKTNFDELEFQLKGNLIKSNLIIDGGNVEIKDGIGIFTDKLFIENKTIPPSEIEKELCRLLNLKNAYFIPWDKSDIIGHIDGVLRLYNKNTVLLNNYNEDPNPINRNLKDDLEDYGFDVIEIPYNPYKNKTNLSAKGIYINYLKANDLIFLPVFEIKEDDTALLLFKELYGKENVIPVNCNKIAPLGGLLNCISWNIID